MQRKAEVTMLEATPRPALPHVPAALLPLVLTGCTEEQYERFAALVLLIFLLAAIPFVVLLTVLIVNIVAMIRKKPNLTWAITSCVCSGLVAISSFAGALRGSRYHLSSLALAAALGWVGQKNARDAQRLAVKRDADRTIDPPTPPHPPPERPPGTLTPPRS